MFAKDQEAVRLVALNQPHRKGSDDYRRASAFGRGLLDGLIKVPGYDTREGFRAAELFTRALADMRWVLDSRAPLTKRGVIVLRELNEARARKILRHWQELVCEIGVALGALVYLADEPSEEIRAPEIIYLMAGEGLAEVADFYRLPKGATR